MNARVISVFSLVPSLLVAQAQASMKTDTRASASIVGQPPATAAVSSQAQARAEFHAPASFSTEGRVRLEAMFKAARDSGLPDRSMRNRVAEGQAKQAPEATIIGSTAAVHARLQASQDAMIRAGRRHPSDAEVESGEQAMERGVTSAQVEAVAKRTPPDRSCAVALDVLGSLVARGEPVSQALAEVQAKIDGHASDETIVALAAGSDNAQGTSATGSGGSASTTATAAGGVTAAAKGVGGATGSVSGGVAGTITDALKKP